MKRFTILLLMTTIGALFAESGVFFLRTEVSPLNISTAQTYYMMGNDIENANYNPASIFHSENIKTQISYRKFQDEGQMGSFGISKKMEKHMIGFKVSYMYMDNFEGRLVPSIDPLYEFDSRNFITDLIYGYKFNMFKFGFAAKYIYEKIEFEDAGGFAFSTGIYMDNLLTDNLDFAFSLNNLGVMSKLNNESSDLPTDITLGLSYKFETEMGISTSVAISEKYLLTDEELESYSGLEVGYQNKIFARFGYRFNNEGIPFSAGLGFNFKNMSLNYSYSPFSDEIGDSHGLGFTYSFE
ncbi:MAG: PorV/PorQ family protein [Candidatus Delongbacteria bacterium]|nr:PorV/PorQ family protein [Candidatus Delongbacteria bacterium]